MNEIKKKEEEICKIFRVIDNWAKKAVSTNKFDGASVYNPHNGKELATTLVNAGYGDVKQAVREFAEKIYEEFDKMEEHYNMTADWNGESAVSWCSSKVKELVKEVCGE